MRITRLIAKDYLGLSEIDMEFARINLVTGRNGAGKSSIRDAMLYAMTGRARSTDAAGRGAERLVRVGASTMRVRLEMLADDGTGLVCRREWSGGKTQEAVAPPLNADLVEACLDVPHLLTVDGKTRSALLSRLICPPLSIDQVCELARAEGATEAVCRALAAGLAKDGPEIGPAQLESAYKRVYEKRRDLKRDLEAARGRVGEIPTRPVPEPEDLERTHARVLALEAEARQKRTVAADLKAKADELVRLVEEQGKISAEMDSLGTSTVSAQPSLVFAVGGSPVELEVELKKAHVEKDKAETDFAALGKKVEAALSNLVSATEAVRAAAGGSVQCPSIHAPAECPLSVASLEARKARIPDLKAAEAKAVKAHSKAATAYEAQRTVVSTVRKQAAEIEHALQAANLRAAEARGAGTGRLEALAKRRCEIEARIDDIGDVEGAAQAAADELADAEWKLDLEREKFAEDKLVAAQEEARAADVQAVRDLEAKVAVLEGIVGLLEPKGLPSRIVAEASGLFSVDVNYILHMLTGGEYGIEIAAGAKGVELQVIRAGTDRPLPPENLSTSERLRLGLALAAAVSAKLRLPLVIDDSEILDASGKQALQAVLKGLPEEIESVVVIATADQPKATSRPGFHAFWVESGTARLVEAAAEVKA